MIAIAYSLATTLEALRPITTKAVGAILILFGGFILGRLLGLLLQRLLNALGLDRAVKASKGVRLSLEKQLGTLLSIILYAVTIVLALRYLGLASAVLAIIAGAVILLVLISFVLSVKDLLPNAIAGIIIHHREGLKTGDRIRVKNIEGVVDEVGFLSVRLRSGSDVIVIPNVIFQRDVFTRRKHLKGGKR